MSITGGKQNPTDIPVGLLLTSGQPGMAEMSGNERNNKKTAPANRQCQFLRPNLLSC